jgi:uroporphyrinogen decarboxylase
MNSRERILKALAHEEPDRVPFDLAGTTWSGIAAAACANLLKQLQQPEETPDWADVIQQIVVPSEKMLDLLRSDTRGLRPLTSHNWEVYEKLTDAGENWEYVDEWKFTHHFPKQNGHWFSLVKHPMEHLDPPGNEDIVSFSWPQAADKRRIAGLREQALWYREQGKIVIIKGLCAGIFEMHQRVRGMANAMLEPFIYPEFSDLLAGKIADLKIEFWEMALNELADVVFWGGGIDTQHVLPSGSPDDIAAHVKTSLDALAPGGGFVFATVHNIQSEVPPQNIMKMWDTLMLFGKY